MQIHGLPFPPPTESEMLGTDRDQPPRWACSPADSGAHSSWEPLPKSRTLRLTEDHVPGIPLGCSLYLRFPDENNKPERILWLPKSYIQWVVELGFKSWVFWLQSHTVISAKKMTKRHCSIISFHFFNILKIFFIKGVYIHQRKFRKYSKPKE